MKKILFILIILAFCFSIGINTANVIMKPSLWSVFWAALMYGIVVWQIKSITEENSVLRKWVIKTFESKKRVKLESRIKSLFLLYFQGDQNMIPKCDIPPRQFGINSFKFFYYKSKIIIEIEAENPWLLCDPAGMVMIPLEEYLTSRVKKQILILPQESKVWT